MPSTMLFFVTLSLALPDRLADSAHCCVCPPLGSVATALVQGVKIMAQRDLQ